MSIHLNLLLKYYFEGYKGIPRQCWNGIFLIFIDSIAGGLCFFFSVYFVAEFYLNIAMANLLVSIYGLGTVIGGIAGGKLSDKFSPKMILGLSLIVQSIGYGLLVWLGNFYSLIFIIFLLGLAAYGFKTSNNIWMLNNCEEQLRLKVINVARTASNLGLGIIGTLIGLFAVNNFRKIFLFSSFLFLFSLFFVFQPSRLTYKLNEIKNNSKEKNIAKSDKANLSIIYLIIFNVFIVGMLIAQLGSTYPIYLKNAYPELGMKAVSVLFILDTLLIVVFQTSLTHFLKRYNKFLIIGLGGFMMGLGMFILSFSHSFIWAIFSCFVWTTGEMLFIPMSQLVCYELSAFNKKGKVMGWYQSIYALSSIIGPVSGGLVYQYWCGQTLWLISFIIGLISLISFTFAEFKDLRVKFKDICYDFKWLLGIIIGFIGVLLGLMARGFHWIN